MKIRSNFDHSSEEESGESQPLIQEIQYLKEQL